MNKTQVAIIGQGPAGLSAAIYTGRAGIDTTIIGCSPKIAGNYDIDNYFGFSETISGKELIKRGKAQAERFGVKMCCEKAIQIHQNEQGIFHIKTDAQEYEAEALILATGVSRIKPGIENLNDYEGKGISYCVSCDGFFYRNKKVMVLGEAIFAANQSLELLQYTPNISICTQKKQVGITPEFKKKLEEASIQIKENKIIRLEGKNGLEQVVYDDGTQEDVDGLFIAMGEASSSDFAYTLGLTRKGVFIEADCEQKTNLPGVFAAGDCVGRFLQISVAVGEGAKAARSAIAYIKTLNKK